MLHLFKWRVHHAGNKIYKRSLGVLLSTIFICFSAQAHDGHDHGQEETVVASQVLPRVVATSEQFELVGIAENDALVIYLDGFATNVPVADATVEVTIGSDVVLAETEAEGLYSVTSEALIKPGDYELIFSITTPDTADLLIGTLRVAETATIAGEAARPFGLPVWWLAGGLLFVGILIGWLGSRSRPASATVASLIAVATIGMMPFTAEAHEGHDHGAEETAPIAGDRPTRLPDGSVFLPKPTQRLLSIRTNIFQPVLAGKSYSLAGQTIPDPNASGVVQAVRDGQILRARTRLPALGHSVNRGDVLAELVPTISADAGVDLVNERAALDQSITLLERRLERLRALEPVAVGEDGASIAAVPEARITDLETELEALKIRRSNIRQVAAAPSKVRASADGVITRINFQPGQVVAAGDTLFEIVDPAHVWAETVMYADQGASQTSDTFSGVEVILPNGAIYEASLAGESPTLVNQARVMQFRIETDVPMSIGAAVTVRLQTEAHEEAFLVPNETIVRGASGLSVIWTHTGAETFEPIIVDAKPYDGARMQILSALPEDARIVTNGASFLEQVR